MEFYRKVLRFSLAVYLALAGLLAAAAALAALL